MTVAFQQEELIAALEELSGEPVPPSRIDLDQALRDGLRGRRNRRMRGVLSAVAAVCVIVVALLPVLSGKGATSAQPAAPTTTGTTASLPPSSTVPGTGHCGIGSDTITPVPVDAFRLTTPVSFGWLPTGVTTITSGFSDGETADFVTATAGNRRALALMCMGTRRPGAEGLYETPAPDINGHLAYWSSQTKGNPVDGSGTLDLTWQNTTGQWLNLIADQQSGSQAEATVEHIASTVTTEPRDLPLPISISHLPGDIRISGAVLATGTGGNNSTTKATLDFALDGTEFHLEAGPVDTVGIPTSATTSQCKQAGTLSICAAATGPDTVLPGGLTTLLRDTTALGADPSRWTATPFNPQGPETP